MTSGTPQPRPVQPQPTPTFAITTVSEDENQIDTLGNPRTTTASSSSPSGMLRPTTANYSTPPKHNLDHALSLLSNTPVEEAVKLDGAEFEHVMKERTRARREKETSQVAELRVKVQRLELALAAETKRRVEATRALELHAQDQVSQMEQRCLQEMKEHRQLVDARLDKLESQLDELQQRLDLTQQQQLEHLANKGKEFTSALQELRKESETERKLRSVREGQFLQQIESHEKEYEELWNAEKQERIEAVAGLVHQMESNEQARLEQRRNVEARLEKELALLQDALDLEVLERKRRDDEIAAELNRCTVQFQQHLAVLTEDD